MTVVRRLTGETEASSGVDPEDGSFRIFVAPGSYYVVLESSVPLPPDPSQSIQLQSNLVDVRWNSSQLTPPQFFDVVSGHNTNLAVVTLQPQTAR